MGCWLKPTILGNSQTLEESTTIFLVDEMADLYGLVFRGGGLVGEFLPLVGVKKVGFSHTWRICMCTHV